MSTPKTTAELLKVLKVPASLKASAASAKNWKERQMFKNACSPEEFLDFTSAVDQFLYLQESNRINARVLDNYILDYKERVAAKK